MRILTKPSEDRTDTDLSFIAPFVSQLKFFKEKKLEPLDILYLCRDLTYEVFNSYETIFNFGDIGNKFYIILKGQVEIKIPDISKKYQKKNPSNMHVIEEFQEEKKESVVIEKPDMIIMHLLKQGATSQLSQLISS